MQSDPTIPEGHVLLISPRGGQLAVEAGSVDEQDLITNGWMPADSEEGQRRSVAMSSAVGPIDPSVLDAAAARYYAGGGEFELAALASARVRLRQAADALCASPTRKLEAGQDSQCHLCSKPIVEGEVLCGGTGEHFPAHFSCAVAVSRAIR